MAVAGDQKRVLVVGESYEVVVVRIGGAQRGWVAWILDEESVAAKECEIVVNDVEGNVAAELVAAKDLAQLVKEERGDDQLKSAGASLGEDPCRFACRRDQGGDEDAGVKDDLQREPRELLSTPGGTGPARCVVLGLCKSHLLCSREAALIMTGDLAGSLPRPGMLGTTKLCALRPSKRPVASPPLSTLGGRPPLPGERTKCNRRSCARPDKCSASLRCAKEPDFDACSAPPRGASGRPGRTIDNWRSSAQASASGDALTRHSPSALTSPEAPSGHAPPYVRSGARARQARVPRPRARG